MKSIRHQGRRVIRAVLREKIKQVKKILDLQFDMRKDCEQNPEMDLAKAIPEGSESTIANAYNTSFKYCCLTIKSCSSLTRLKHLIFCFLWIERISMTGRTILRIGLDIPRPIYTWIYLRTEAWIYLDISQYRPGYTEADDWCADVH